MAPPIPDRWKDYKPVGQQIEGTRFIAFKVPLRERISKTVESDIRLDGTVLLKSIPNLGIIIDLTNTKRYYDPYFFEAKGVEYAKLMIPGHDTPQKALVDKFKKLVKDFLANNSDNDKLVGVHCTHGVNRTGYLICNYMISEMKIDPNEAISRFGDARGHKIERVNYLNALLQCNEFNGEESKEVSSTSINRRKSDEASARDTKCDSRKRSSDNWRNRDEAPANKYRYNSKERSRENWRNRDRPHERSKDYKTYGRDSERSPNRYKKYGSKSPETNRENRNSRWNRWRYEKRSESKSTETYRKERNSSSRRSPNSSSRSSSSAAYRRNRSISSSRRDSSPRHCQNTRNDDR